jgi:hypothetical protein
MKNQKLKNLISLKDLAKTSLTGATILNDDEIACAMGGTSVLSCPSLTSCGTFGNCETKCSVKVF